MGIDAVPIDFIPDRADVGAIDDDDIACVVGRAALGIGIDAVVVALMVALPLVEISIEPVVAGMDAVVAGLDGPAAVTVMLPSP